MGSVRVLMKHDRMFIVPSQYIWERYGFSQMLVTRYKRRI
jgi:hypothetical protein